MQRSSRAHIQNHHMMSRRTCREYGYTCMHAYSTAYVHNSSLVSVENIIIWTIGRTKVIYIISNVRTMTCMRIQSHFGYIDHTVVVKATYLLQSCVSTNLFCSIYEHHISSKLLYAFLGLRVGFQVTIHSSIGHREVGVTRSGRINSYQYT